MVRVVATQRCFPDLRLREEGEVFDYDGPIAKGGPLRRLDEPAESPARHYDDRPAGPRGPSTYDETTRAAIEALMQ